MQNWKKALEYANLVLDKRDGLLNLNSHTPDTEVLTKASPETIFSMGGYPLAGCMYCSREEENKYPAYVVSEDLLSAFIEGDNDWRTQYYIMKESIGGISTNYVCSGQRRHT